MNPKEEPDLLSQIGNCIDDDGPLELLATISTLIAAADPRYSAPSEPDTAKRTNKKTQANLDDLIAAFSEIDRIETTAALAVIGELAPDELMRARAKRYASSRQHALPEWLAKIDKVKVSSAFELSYVLNDGETLGIGVEFPTQHELTTFIYVDHNLGTVLKDAFVKMDSIETMINFTMSIGNNPDMTCNKLDPKVFRARVEEAMNAGAIMRPPFETDTWPACKPIVEWILRKIPEGGQGYVRPPWNYDEREALILRFLASRYADPSKSTNYKMLAELFISFACDYGNGDPTRWSAVAVEILLDDWIPRKVMANTAFLSAIPTVLRAFIEFCHDETKLKKSLTKEALDAVNEYEREHLNDID